MSPFDQPKMSQIKDTATNEFTRHPNTVVVQNSFNIILQKFFFNVESNCAIKLN